MTRALGSLRADAFGLLDELGTSGTMTMLASACREEIARQRDRIERCTRKAVIAEAETEIAIWQARLDDIVRMTDKRPTATWSDHDRNIPADEQDDGCTYTVVARDPDDNSILEHHDIEDHQTARDTKVTLEARGYTNVKIGKVGGAL